MLVYLNPKWDESNGGALRITSPEPSSSSLSSDAEMVDVYPIAGRVVLFYSSQVPHEVLPVIGNERHALTIW